MFSIHLVSFTAQAEYGGDLEYGIARVGTDGPRPSTDDCERTIPGFVSAEYLGPEPLYLLQYRTNDGVQKRRLGATAVSRVGRLVASLADRYEACDIEVLDEEGHDVTFDFAVFCH